MNPIDPRIHQVLDGEIPREALPQDLRRVVERLESAAALLAAAPEGRSVAERVLAVLRRPARSPVRRLAQWLTAPHPVTLRIRPVWSLALAATLVLLMLLPEERSVPVLGEHEGIAQFVARFPGAHSVQVVGSFNDWRTGTIPLEDRDGDGVCRAVVVLPAGAHEYMFVVDDERWVPDYSANRFVEDDFGRENSVLIVRPVKG